MPENKENVTFNECPKYDQIGMKRDLNDLENVAKCCGAYSGELIRIIAA